LAIARFERPSATSASTSRSRAVSSSIRASAEARETSPLGHRLVDHAATGCDPLKRVKEDARVGDAILEQVAGPSRVPLRDAQCVAGVQVLGEHEHADLRERRTDALGRHQALVFEGRRHPDVDQRDIG